MVACAVGAVIVILSLLRVNDQAGVTDAFALSSVMLDVYTIKGIRGNPTGSVTLPHDCTVTTSGSDVTVICPRPITTKRESIRNDATFCVTSPPGSRNAFSHEPIGCFTFDPVCG